MKREVSFFTILIVFLSLGCVDKQAEKIVDEEPSILSSFIIADTITVDVTLRAIDTTSLWDVEQHMYINQQALLDYIFNCVYSEKYKAYDFYSGKNLSVQEIKAIESQPGYSRELVSKILFKELWYIDTAGILQKKPYNYTLAIEHYSEMGTFVGHKALFKVKLQ